MSCKVFISSLNRNFPLEKIELSLEESHHLLHVLRLKKGDVLLALDGRGFSQKGILEFELKKKLFFQPLEPLHYTPQKDHQIPVSLAVGLPKKETFDWILEKSTELGLSTIQPLLTNFSSFPTIRKNTADFQEKWIKKTQQALKQCGRTWSPQINPTCSLLEWTEQQKKRPTPFLTEYFWLDEKPENQLSPKESLHQTKKMVESLKCVSDKHYYLLVGPEGGWSENERIFLSQSFPQKINRLFLGNVQLRTETACLYAMSLFNFFLNAEINHG